MKPLLENKSLEKAGPGQARELTDAERRVLLARSQFDRELRETAQATRGALAGWVAVAGMGAVIVVVGVGLRALFRARRQGRHSWVIRISVEPGRPAPRVLPALAEGVVRLTLARFSRGRGGRRVLGGADGGLPSGALGSNASTRGTGAGEGWSEAPPSVV